MLVEFTTGYCESHPPEVDGTQPLQSAREAYFTFFAQSHAAALAFVCRRSCNSIANEASPPPPPPPPPSSLLNDKSFAALPRLDRLYRAGFAPKVSNPALSEPIKASPPPSSDANAEVTADGSQHVARARAHAHLLASSNQSPSPSPSPSPRPSSLPLPTRNQQPSL